MFCTNCGKEIKEGSAFCVYCGARIGENPSRTAQNTVLNTPMPENGNIRGLDSAGKTEGRNMGSSGFTDQAAGIRQIIGKNEEYYLKQFDRIHREGKGQINWASFFFGLLHASYRGVWREWVKKMALPLGIEFGCMLLMAIMFLIQPVVVVIFAIIAMIVSIWVMIAQILFSKKFNQVYMQHVEQKLAKADLTADPSVKRLIIAGLIWSVIIALLQVLVSAAVMGGILGGLMFMGGVDTSDLDSDWNSYMEDTDWSGYMEDSDTDDPGILEDPIPEESFPEEEEIPAVETQDDSESEETGYALWEASYQRCYGPSAYIQLLSVDEDGILFSAAIGVSGYAAYVDMREYHADWTDAYTAVYEEGTSTYALQIVLNEDGSITVYDTEPYYGSLQLAGIYTKESEADFPNCEYVFPHSSFAYLSLNECEGLNELECRIARNEIYARHGRRFSDESLQAYFDSCSWYEGFIEPSDFLEDMLSEVEQENIRTINEYETTMGF